MALNLEKMRQEREAKQGADFWTAPEGDTLCYLCPPCREDDELNFYEIAVHYSVMPGKDKSMAVCLDPNFNRILSNPHLQEILTELGKDIEGGCPCCEALDGGEIKDTARADRMKRQSKYLWGVVPLKFRPGATTPWSAIPPQYQPLFGGWQVWDGFMELISNEGDVTDFDKAILARLNRKGKGQQNTKYTIQADSDTLRKPMSLSPEVRALLAASLVPGGKGDAYTTVGRMIKPRADLQRLMAGVAEAVDESAEEGEAVEETAPAPKKAAPAKKVLSVVKPAAAVKPAAKAAKKNHHGFGDDVIAERGPVPDCYTLDCSAEDIECQGCPYKVECAGAMGVDVPPDVEPAAEEPAVEEEAPVEEVAEEAPAEEVVEEAAAEEAPAEEEPVAEETAPAGDAIEAKDAELDLWYTLPDESLMQFKGIAKGWAWFEDQDGARAKQPLDAAVTQTEVVMEEEAPPPPPPPKKVPPKVAPKPAAVAPKAAPLAVKVPPAKAPAKAPAALDDDPTLKALDAALLAKKVPPKVAPKPAAVAPKAAPLAVKAPPPGVKPVAKVVAVKK